MRFRAGVAAMVEQCTLPEDAASSILRFPTETVTEMHAQSVTWPTVTEYYVHS